MNCAEARPYLPGYAGGELQDATTRAVAAHASGCERCRREVSALEAVRSGLLALGSRELDPPPYLVDAVLEDIRAKRHRRLLPIPPVPPEQLVRALQDNREAILSAAGAVLVAAGAAYAVWRAFRAARPQAEPAR